MTPVTAAALAVVEQAAQDRFDEIQARFAPALRSLVPPDALRSAWQHEVAGKGALTSVGEPASEPAGGPGAVLVTIPVTFERGALAVVVGLAGEQNWITGIQLRPPGAAAPGGPWEPPGYADPAAFTEHEVTVGDGPLAVPGTMSRPARTGPWPGVVLLPGSGPNDRDETIGRNKPLKDLAWGLATAGVAVLRFDKVTYAHGGLVARNEGFTLTDEYVPHAVAAVRLLAGQSRADGSRVFVAGHSLGGTVAPRVAAAQPSVAGLVILAGGIQPLHWSAVRQFRYLAALGAAGQASAGQATVAAITRQAQAVDALTDAATAQVTVDDDLPLWRAALDGRPGVTIAVYEADNHLFFSGSGPSSPAEYEPAQHVDQAVVEEIAAWVQVPLG